MCLKTKCLAGKWNKQNIQIRFIFDKTSEKWFGNVWLYFLFYLQGPDCMGKHCTYGRAHKPTKATMTSWHKCDNFPHNTDTFGIRQSSVVTAVAPKQQKKGNKQKSSKQEREHLITATCLNVLSTFSKCSCKPWQDTWNNDHKECWESARAGEAVHQVHSE